MYCTFLQQFSNMILSVSLSPVTRGHWSLPPPPGGRAWPLSVPPSSARCWPVPISSSGSGCWPISLSSSGSGLWPVPLPVVLVSSVGGSFPTPTIAVSRVFSLILLSPDTIVLFLFDEEILCFLSRYSLLWWRADRVMSFLPTIIVTFPPSFIVNTFLSLFSVASFVSWVWSLSLYPLVSWLFLFLLLISLLPPVLLLGVATLTVAVTAAAVRARAAARLALLSWRKNLLTLCPRLDLKLNISFFRFSIE